MNYTVETTEVAEAEIEAVILKSLDAGWKACCERSRVSPCFQTATSWPRNAISFIATFAVCCTAAAALYIVYYSFWQTRMETARWERFAFCISNMGLRSEWTKSPQRIIPVFDYA